MTLTLPRRALRDRRPGLLHHVTSMLLHHRCALCFISFRAWSCAECRTHLACLSVSPVCPRPWLGVLSLTVTYICLLQDSASTPPVGVPPTDGGKVTSYSI
eukprot:scaffold25533_cov60-Phaeocystis_antarctica.AAC.1